MVFNTEYSEEYRMKYAPSGEGITIVSYEGDETDVRIPGQLGGKPVVRVEAYAFSGKSMKYIHFPQTLEVIDHHGFSECRNLHQVILPEKLKTVGNYAFYNCWAVEKVHLTPYIKSIGFGAFKNCEKLTEIIQDKCEGYDISIGSLLDDLSQQIHVTIRHLKEDGKYENAMVIFTEHDYDAGSFTAAWNKQYEFSAIGSGKYMRYCIGSRDIDYNKYDSMFHVLLREDSFDTIVTVAVERLMYPYSLGSEAAAVYSGFISEHSLDAMKKFIKDDTMDKAVYMTENRLLDENACDSAIDLASAMGRTAYTALLMDYRHKEFMMEDLSFEL